MIEERNDMQMDFDEDAQYTERKRILFFGLPWTFTKYNIKPSVITVDAGLFKIEENDCYMYKVQDVEHKASLLERICGLGTITCFTGDTTHPKLIMPHIKHSKTIKNYILEASEAARMRRRTLNTLDIGSMADADDLD